MKFNVLAIPESVELLPGSKLRLHHTADNGEKFYLEEELVLAAARIRQMPTASDSQECGTPQTNTTYSAQLRS